MLIIPPTSQTLDSVLNSIPTKKDHYLIFMASPALDGERVGRPWCRDCQHAEAPISANIKENESTLIYVGSREEWNEPNNTWRQEPFKVERVPTLLKIPAGSEEGIQSAEVSKRVSGAPRIVEGDILEKSKLTAFLKA